MQPFKWNKKHEVFVPELDAEHRDVFRVAEELRAIASAGNGDQVQKLLGELVADAEEHFRHEERLMRSAHYPLLDWHKKQHETVRKRFRKYSGEMNAGDPQAITALLDFLAVWLKDHTGLSDRMMGAYIRNYRRLHAEAL